ncbi:MAG: hypothetical protein K0S56_978 [Microvirga sp.]|nr:hypothetical protein [Microvirga sp.]
MERPAGMTAEPVDHLGVLVGGKIVEDSVNRLASRDLALDGVEEADELLMPVPLHAAADDITLQDVESGEQGGRAVALVSWVMVPARRFFMGRPGWVRSRA